jgi:hypothetical protein
LALKSEAESHLIQAWACFKRGENKDAASFCNEASDELYWADKGGWEQEVPPIETGKRRWWFEWRKKNPPEEPKAVEGCPTVTTRKGIMKKLIGLIILSGSVGVGSHFVPDVVQGPTQLVRGEFLAVQQCDSCESIWSEEEKLCTKCGSTTAIEKIAAPLTHRLCGFLWDSDDGWQFKDGSTKLHSAGEYIVPELVVRKTKRL